MDFWYGYENKVIWGIFTKQSEFFFFKVFHCHSLVNLISSQLGYMIFLFFTIFT